jgi:hypothetical protein
MNYPWQSFHGRSQPKAILQMLLVVLKEHA